MMQSANVNATADGSTNDFFIITYVNRFIFRLRR
jgi:hypothetical protein